MQNVGLFTAAAATPPSIPSGTTLAATSGYAAEAKGDAVYAYDAAPGTATSTSGLAYLAAHPRSAFAAADGRIFRLADAVTERTPHMFGAAGDGTNDDGPALQAFFDDAYDSGNAKRNSYNFEGQFATGQRLFAAYPIDDETRRFRAGRLLVLAPASAPLDTVLTIGGTRQVWQGELAVQDGGNANTGYTGRRFDTGIRFVSAGQSSVEVIRVDGAKRDAVLVDGTYAAISFDTGARTVSYVNRNNIGLRIGSVYARGSGSYNAYGYGTSQTISDRKYGGDETSGSEDFVESLAFSNGGWQRTQLTVGSTAELRAGDVGKVRLELSASDYGTVSASHSGSSFTWSSGDPVVNAKLAVGDTIYPQNGANAG